MKYMFHHLTRHLPHYLSLLGIIVVAGVGMYIFRYDKYFQSAIAISAGVAYVVWGIIHHHVIDQVHHKIHSEYLAIALLGVVVLLGVIWA